ncbi:MAG TPA: hypothetical protein VEV83_04005 [Parafilimonas sp.]|nr:hypothetical protein [Parafilimonas sp.]
MKFKFIIPLLFLSGKLLAGYTVRVVVTGPVNNRTIYIAGTFNNWNRCGTNYKLAPAGDNKQQIVLTNIPGGLVEYKFTKGGWENVETTNIATEIPNRRFHLTRDTKR